MWPHSGSHSAQASVCSLRISNRAVNRRDDQRNTIELPKGISKGTSHLTVEMSLKKVTTCLWFDGQAEEAANLYTSVFANSKITFVQRYSDAGKETHGREPGTVMAVGFELNGHPFVGLNGGPQFRFSEAISFQIDCVDQAEVDHFWDKLGEGGDDAKSRCGWLADRFGVSWQVIPTVLKDMLAATDRARADRATKAMMGMKKLDIAVLQQAFDG
ncbi:3-demethylubiquinone-9 3-methyltransferase-domain-containing protein [Diplogelasinospora grovesii]|uniref:3-demethylubiquinone-9 3-methyltransferase-domain-containing protein n=1 Tax=Diplogelasinospora grovesii TaxID=303347 RepID=A0AAN6MZK3_9PEZI|nr:3-demethylubiquinone-9 3-methyltransferase-domain-containing protein [Diplogelasinospora grovesii]